MAGLEEMWARFSLSKEEDRGAEVSGQGESTAHHLAGKFLTKRVINVDAVARTFKPLWKPRGELKIRDVGENILLFEFEDCLDLERVLEFEPWSYDKSLVVFQRALDAESALTLDYTRCSFWIQIHNVPDYLLSQEIVESVGKTLGKVLQVADPEDDGVSGEFLRVRISLDILRPLPRCLSFGLVRNLWDGSGDVRPRQNVTDNGRGMATHREGSVSNEVESIQRFSPVVEVGQIEKLSFEMVHEDRLDRGIVGLTISESEALQAPRVEQVCQAPSMAHVVQADALNGSPSSSPGPTLFTKAWKRLAVK
uniref:DUF4283 domain-containing protein n=1 Tax=Quercus lobata TaxID=97700 RepID=A0A7N2MXZ0_QUELO